MSQIADSKYIKMTEISAARLIIPGSVVGTILFQRIGKSVLTLIRSCVQSGAVFIPLCLILPHFFGVIAIEVAQPLAYFMSALISLPMTLVFLKRLPKDECTDKEEKR